MWCPHIHIQSADIDVPSALHRLRGKSSNIGAVVSFTGTVRAEGSVETELKFLHLEHYPGMTERVLAELVEEARSRFQLLNAVVIHRVGSLRPAEPIVFVATAAPHRHAAFEGCEFLMDALKSRAPFWKRVTTEAGHSFWVKARAADDLALARWDTL